jgi:hypothetical protein
MIAGLQERTIHASRTDHRRDSAIEATSQLTSRRDILTRPRRGPRPLRGQPHRRMPSSLEGKRLQFDSIFAPWNATRDSHRRRAGSWSWPTNRFIPIWIFIPISRLARSPLFGCATRKQPSSRSRSALNGYRGMRSDFEVARTIALQLLSTQVPVCKHMNRPSGTTIRSSESPSAKESPRHSARQRLSDRTTDCPDPMAQGRPCDRGGPPNRIALLPITRGFSYPSRSSARGSDFYARRDQRRVRNTAGCPGMYG